MAARRLPERPSLTSLKHQAKQLLRAHRAGNPEARSRFAARHPEASPEFPLGPGDVSLADAQLIIAREYGLPSWPALVSHIEDGRADHLPQITLDLQTLPDHQRALTILRESEPDSITEQLRNLVAKHPQAVVVRAGQSISRQDAAGMDLCPGDALRPSADRSRLVSSSFGIICREATSIHVLRPLWIAANGMTAYYVDLPQGDDHQRPNADELEHLLTGAGVRHGAEGAAAAIAAWHEADSWLVPVARATPPSAAIDARFEWAVQVQLVGGGIPDATYTLAAGESIRVKAGDLLGELVAPASGNAGTDVLGRPVAAARPQNLEVVTNARVVTQEAGQDRMRFIAASDGGVYASIQSHQASARPGTRIELGVYPMLPLP